MKIGLSTLLFVRSTVEDSIRHIAELGAECIELIFDVPHFFPGDNSARLDVIREILSSYDLPVTVHAVFWDLNPASHYQEICDLALHQTMKSIEACARLGGSLVTLHPGKAAVSEPGMEWFTQAAERRCLQYFSACVAFAEDVGVRVAAENIGLPFYVCSSLEELGEIADEIDGLGITLDIGHAYRREKSNGVDKPEEKIAGLVKNLGKRIVHVHLHDNHGERDEHLVPGDGEINFTPIVSALQQGGYRGAVVVELFDSGDPIAIGKRGLEKAREMFGKGVI
ncbi:MAG: sugar phosphate isomerase/epimerase [Candidatus Hadarchaeales archaeon]